MESREKAAFRPYVDVLLDQLERRADGTVLRYLDEDVSGSTFSASIYRHARALETLGIGRA
jgi:fatty-acyl-CoA synthase